jgi:hypothetical protein
MGFVYGVPYTGTLTNTGGNADLFELTPADDKPILLRGLVLSQTSELGDTAEESLDITIVRLPATVTSGNGTAVTPTLLNDLAPAAGFAAEANGATVATTSGTAATLVEFAWNIRNSPLEMWWPEDKYAITCRQASALVVRCNSTVADDITICITAYVEEY